MWCLSCLSLNASSAQIGTLNWWWCIFNHVPSAVSFLAGAASSFLPNCCYWIALGPGRQDQKQASALVDPVPLTVPWGCPELLVGLQSGRQWFLKGMMCPTICWSLAPDARPVASENFVGEMCPGKAAAARSFLDYMPPLFLKKPSATCIPKEILVSDSPFFSLSLFIFSAPSSAPAIIELSGEIVIDFYNHILCGLYAFKQSWKFSNPVLKEGTTAGACH